MLLSVLTHSTDIFWRKCQKIYENIYVQVMRLASPRYEVQAHICFLVCGTPWWVLVQHSIMLQLFFLVKCGIACLLCAMHVFKVWISSSSPRLGYLCAKFRFFHGLHCWASPWRKIAYSITHPAYLMPRESKHLHFGIMQLSAGSLHTFCHRLKT